MRKNEEDDAEQEKRPNEDAEESESKEVEERADRSEKTDNPTDKQMIRTNERAESSNETPVRVNLQSVRDEQEPFEPDNGLQEGDADYETDELIKRAIEDDDEDIEELISNDDL